MPDFATEKRDCNLECQLTAEELERRYVQVKLHVVDDNYLSNK